MIGAVIGAISMVLLTTAGIAYPEVISAVGTKRSSRLYNISKQLYNMIADNQDLVDKLADAYQHKDADLATQLLQGAGYGPRSQAIREAANKAREAYFASKKELTKQGATLTNMYNEVNQAMANTNSIAGNKQARRVADSVEQAIQGGANDAQDKQ